MPTSIGDTLRYRRATILKRREDEERYRTERITKPFLSGASGMIDRIKELHNDSNPDEELLIGSNLLVGVFGIAREFEKELLALEQQQNEHGLPGDNSLVDEFVAKIFENFKKEGGGKILCEFCILEGLGTNFELSAEGMIDCYVTWLD